MPDRIPFLPIEDMTPRFVVAAMSETQDWGLLVAGIPKAWQMTRGAGVTVAVLDTGGPDHEDLKDGLLPAINVSGEPTAEDKQGHGTHVAGIIGARENGMGIVGVAPEVRILPVKVLDNAGHSSFEEVAAGIRAAVAAGADIINMSLGSPAPAPQVLQDAIREAAAKGVVIVAAAGNDGGSVNFPARYDEVIAVAALDKSGKMARFSSRGNEVDAVAPGTDIYSTYLNQNYALLNGTSQAAPFISGICALLLSWSRSTPGMRPISGVQEMLQRLDDLCDPEGRVHAAGRYGEWGFGVPSFANNMPWKS